jgi:GNAT superfamily N-acetyltransferase
MKHSYAEVLDNGKALAVCELINAQNGLMIQRIKVPRGYRGQGIGSKLLKRVLEAADREFKTLYLSVCTTDYGMSYDQLEAWYMRNGFIYKNGIIMVRRPNKYYQKDTVREEKAHI